MEQTAQKRNRRILWRNVLTVTSAAILIGAEVFGAGFAAGWAFAFLFNLGEYGVPILQGIFMLIGAIVMWRFVRYASHIEPFVVRE